MRETAERRRLHNTLVDMKGAIRVFARLRPPFAQEAGAQPAVACDTMGAIIDATTRWTASDVFLKVCGTLNWDAVMPKTC